MFILQYHTVQWNFQLINIIIFRSNEVQSSYHMKLKVLKRALTKLEEEHVDVSHLVIDRHSQVKCCMRRDQPKPIHMFDVWHVAKGIAFYNKIISIFICYS